MTPAVGLNEDTSEVTEGAGRMRDSERRDRPDSLALKSNKPWQR